MARFPLWLSRWTIALFCAGLIQTANAGSASATPPDATTVTLSWTVTDLLNGRVSVEMTRTGGYDANWYGGNYVWGIEYAILVSGDGINFGTAVNPSTTGNLGAGTPSSTLVYTFDKQTNSHVKLHFNGRHAGNGSALTIPPSQVVEVIPVLYKITFELPANTNPYRERIWYAEQGELVLGTRRQLPSTGAVSWTVTSDKPDTVTLRYVSGGTLDWDNDGPIITYDTIGTTAASGTPTAGGTPPTIGGINEPNETRPANESTPTPDAEEPEEVMAPDAPDSTPTYTPTTPTDPNPTPSGTTGATKEDIERQTNQLAQAGHTNALNVVNAVNGVVTAINNANAKIHESQSAIINAVNTGNASTVAGINQIVAALNADKTDQARILAAIQNAGVSTREGLNQIGAKIDQTNEILGEIRDTENVFETEQQTLRDERPDTASMQASGNTAKADMQNGLPNPAAMATIDPGSGSAPTLTVQMPAAFGGKTFDLNPFQSSRFATIAAWFRTATAWLVVILFGLNAGQTLQSMVIGLGTVQQARGNAVLGGTGAQATAAIAATIISTVTISAVVAVVGYAVGQFSFGSILTASGINPLNGMPATVLWMIDQLLPVAMIVTALVARLTFNLYAIRIYSGVVAFVRFVTP